MLTWRDFYKAVVTVATVMGVLMLLSWSKAQAHEDGGMKYPNRCCHDMDCAPVDKVEIVPNKQVYAGMSLLPSAKLPSIMMVTTKHGTVAVPEGFKHDTSTDGRMHACIRDWGMGRVLVCIFDPPAM